MKRLVPFLVLLLIAGSLPSCRFLYPNMMFKQKDYQYFDLAQKEIHQYIIQPGDAFTLKIYARDGFRLIDMIGPIEGSSSGGGGSSAGGNTGGAGSANTLTYNVDYEGVVKLPVLGYFFVKGYTETELERILAEKYAGLFVDPWVSIKVINRRIFVFNGSNASVVSLGEQPISLIEVIAKVSGLDADAKAYNIKVIRGDVKNPQIYLVDLSTMEGIRKSDLSIQPNDIILIERRKRVVTDVLKEISPYFAAITTITTLVILVKAYSSGK